MYISSNFRSKRRIKVAYKNDCNYYITTIIIIVIIMRSPSSLRQFSDTFRSLSMTIKLQTDRYIPVVGVRAGRPGLPCISSRNSLYINHRTRRLLQHHASTLSQHRVVVIVREIRFLCLRLGQISVQFSLFDSIQTVT